LDGFQRRSGHGGEGKNFQPLPGIKPVPPARSLVTVYNGKICQYICTQSREKYDIIFSLN
jgi:hypothetical protein